MDKLAMRSIQKAIAISNTMIDAQHQFNSENYIAWAALNSKAMAMSQTNAKLFRMDKPELDKRRYRRYLGKCKVYLVEK